MKYPKSISHSVLSLVACTCAVFFASSCTDSTPVPQLSDQSPPVLLDPETHDPERPVSPIVGPESNVPQPDINSTPWLQFPSDALGDDRLGMIVSGFDAGEIQTQVSHFLLSTSVFRLEQKTPGTGDGYVHMRVYDEAMPTAAHIDFYQPPIDTCLLRDINDPEVNESASVYTSDSGGASVVINSPEGFWYTFERRQSESGQFHYQVDNELPGKLPKEATLSIPGDAFPTVPAYPIFEPAVPVRLLPKQHQVLNANSEYEWVAGPASGHIKINVLAYDEAQAFAGFLVTCWAKDDGRFEMPANVTQAISSSQLSLKIRYSRVYERIDWLNGVLMHQHIEVAE